MRLENRNDRAYDWYEVVVVNVKEDELCIYDDFEAAGFDVCWIEDYLQVTSVLHDSKKEMINDAQYIVRQYRLK